MISTKQNIITVLYLIGIGGLLISLPFSNFLMSFFEFFILGTWILELDFKNKIKSFVTNKPALILTSLYILHIAGLLWTSDFNYALNDLRIKLPLLMMPVVLSTGPKIEEKIFNKLLVLFVIAVSAATLICTKIYLFDEYNDIREISIFISHIRFALLICFSIFILLHFIFVNKSFSKTWKIIFSILGLWLLIFIYILNSLTGISVLIITGISVLLYFGFKSHKKNIKIICYLASFSIILFVIAYVHFVSKDFSIKKPINFNNLEKYTAAGNPYVHDTSSYYYENGNLVYIYVNYDELREAWNKRSRLNFDSADAKGNQVKDILIRYLTSKGLRKDAEGVSSLDSCDIKAIEKGITNYLLLNKIPFKQRIYQIIWEYQNYSNTGNPSGHSVMQRIEYCRVACNIIKDNFFIGVGTGDLQKEFNNYYDISNSQLDKKWRLRAHNQYLTMFVAFGVFGFCWFIFTLLYPAIKLKKFNDYFFFVFFVIVALSMLSEDTLETQAGVTFFAFFYSFLLFNR